jgi:hypothetical protein
LENRRVEQVKTEPERRDNFTGFQYQDSVDRMPNAQTARDERKRFSVVLCSERKLESKLTAKRGGIMQPSREKMMVTVCFAF